MKSVFFNSRAVVVLLLIVSPLFSIAQKGKKDHWFIPNYGKIQFAGDIGFLSVGPGWSYSKENRLETEVLFGYIPKKLNSKGLITFTLKQNYIPWRVAFGENNKFVLTPFTCALALNTVLDSDFGLTNIDRYSDGHGYYGFVPRIHLHLMVGQRISMVNPFYKKKKRYMTVYYELGSNDLTIVTAVKNTSIRPREYLSLGIGVQFGI